VVGPASVPSVADNSVRQTPGLSGLQPIGATAITPRRARSTRRSARPVGLAALCLAHRAPEGFANLRRRRWPETGEQFVPGGRSGAHREPAPDRKPEGRGLPTERAPEARVGALHEVLLHERTTWGWKIGGLTCGNTDVDRVGMRSDRVGMRGVLGEPDSPIASGCVPTASVRGRCPHVFGTDRVGMRGQSGPSGPAIASGCVDNRCGVARIASGCVDNFEVFRSSPLRAAWTPRQHRVGMRDASCGACRVLQWRPGSRRDAWTKRRCGNGKTRRSITCPALRQPKARGSEDVRASSGADGGDRVGMRSVSPTNDYSA